MRLLRSGIYEYDKRKAKPPKVCLSCGKEFSWGTAARKYCGPCYDARSMARRDANRWKYKNRPYNTRKRESRAIETEREKGGIIP